MRKTTYILMLFLLTILSGCQKDMDLVPQMEDAQVRVSMGVCIPSRYTSTRQSAEVTQAAGNAAAFRGIGGMYILPFDGSTKPSDESLLKVAPINLGGVVKGELTSAKSYKFFDDKPLNVGVSHAVVYAEAMPAAGGASVNGAIVPTPAIKDLAANSRLSTIAFALKDMTDDNLSAYKANLAFIINDIIEAKIDVDGDYFTMNETAVTMKKKPAAGTNTLLWKNLVGEQPVGENNDDIDLDDAKLHTLFQNLSQLKSGSATSVLDVVKSLYHVLNMYVMDKHAVQYSGDEQSGYTIKPLASTSDLANHPNGFVDPEAGFTEMIIDRTGLKTAIINKIKEHFVLNATETAVVGYKTEDSHYPGTVNLPDGSLPVVFKADTKYFVYDDPSASILPTDRLNTASITYPASLFYTVNSPLRTRKTELHEADKLQVNTADAWTTALTAGGLWGSDKTGDSREWQTSVRNDSRTVILTDNIRYGVAMLETSVRIASSTLQDNNKKSDGVTPDPNLLAVPAAGFPVTGILVGNQPDRVGWDLHAIQGTTPTSYTKAIYDNSGYEPVDGAYPVTARYSTSTFSEPLRTLCLESQAWGEKDSNGNRPSAFYIALELKNNTGEKFVGADGIVPADGTFYLLAKLDLETDAANGITNVSALGIGTTLTHVLQQGYRTQARLTISSLKNAYNTIPDLRLTKLAFGLSVDLVWQAGARFDL